MDKREMLQEIAKHYGLERNIEFAKYFGITPQSAYARMTKGIMDLEEIYEKCPEISPDWLLSRGEKGPMLRTGGSEPATRKEEENPQDKKNLEAALEALAEEQNSVRRAQEQVSGLIELLRAK